MITITVNAKELKAAVQLCSKVAPKKSTLPVLQNALISTFPDALQLYATNLESGVVTCVPATIDPDGYTSTLTTVNVVNLAQAIKGAKDTVTLLYNPDNGKFSANGYSLLTIDKAEFPPVPTPDPGATLLALPVDFDNAIKSVVVAASTDQARPILTGVHLWSNLKDNTLVLDAADGFRLARRIIPLGTPAKKINAVIPATALTLFANVIGNAGDDPNINMYFDDNKAIMSVNSTDIVSSYTPGTYPDIDRVIPRSKQYTAVVDTAQLIAACDKIINLATFHPTNEGCSKAKMDYGKVVLVFGDNDSLGIGWQIGHVTDNGFELLDPIPAIGEGTPVTIAFNANLIKQGLQACLYMAPTVSIETSVCNAPGSFRANGKYLYLLMPINQQPDNV